MNTPIPATNIQQLTILSSCFILPSTYLSLSQSILLTHFKGKEIRDIVMVYTKYISMHLQKTGRFPTQPQYHYHTQQT